MNIEVEIRSFISKDRYLELLEYFNKNGKLVSEDSQETHYFDSEQDLRIQKSNNYSKVWLKKGKLHDDYREEIEVKINKEDFNKLQCLFLALNYSVNIKWFRTRHTFNWNNISVMLDYTKGYGYIIELEKLSDESDKQNDLKILKNLLKTLNIAETPKEEFNKKYEYYKDNWNDLIKL